MVLLAEIFSIVFALVGFSGGQRAQVCFLHLLKLKITVFETSSRRLSTVSTHPWPGPAPVTKAGHWSVFIIYPASLAQGLPATYEAFELFKSTKVRLDRFYMILTEL